MVLSFGFSCAPRPGIQRADWGSNAPPPASDARSTKQAVQDPGDHAARHWRRRPRRETLPSSSSGESWVPASASPISTASSTAANVSPRFAGCPPIGEDGDIGSTAAARALRSASGVMRQVSSFARQESDIPTGPARELGMSEEILPRRSERGGQWRFPSITKQEE